MNDVELLIDVRAAPGSRRMPHVGKGALEVSLPPRGIAYEHMPELGGRRQSRPDSINAGWRNVSFRAFADYMQEDAFRVALEALEKKAGERRSAIMCAEAVPWRCHRSLISDALTVRGVEVRHITGRSLPSLHTVTAFAVVDNGRISYPAADTLTM